MTERWPEEEVLSAKLSHWSYEKEWRAFVILDPTTVESEMYSYNLDANVRLTEVIARPGSSVIHDQLDFAFRRFKKQCQNDEGSTRIPDFWCVRTEESGI